MTSKLVHRGPDDEGFFANSSVALGMRRLSIVDLAHGQQPFFGTDKRLALVFNGEIYNYRKIRRELEAAGLPFRTQCDTEIVCRALQAWGVDGLKRLEGMFAVAAWDSDATRLILARDWMGQKSIYWTKCEFGWAFASEIKSLLILPGITPRMDLQALSHYMSMRYLPAESTFFEGIHKVPAAHVMEISAAGVSLRRLWTPNYEPKWRDSEGELLDRLDAIMREVVGEHLIGEVPLGAFLSGGIDSSLVVAYAARALSSPLRTFSIGVSDNSQSELPWARQVAERYSTRHSEKIVSPDLADLTPSMIVSMEEPVDPLACGVYVVSREAAKEVTVALGGDGGDELFAGYDRYMGQELSELYAALPRVVRHHVLRPILRRMPDSFGYNTFASKLRWLDEVSDFSGADRYSAAAAFLRFSHARKATLFTPEIWKNLQTHRSERLLEEFFSNPTPEAFLDRMLYADCATRLADHQLPIADKMSMAHSLELRSPFLDRRVVEFAARIPANLKLKQRRTKYFTRKLAERYLPRELIYRPKQGFSFPIAHWLKGDLRPLLEGVVSQSRLAQVGIFSGEEMRRLAQEHWAGVNDHNYRLWMLFNIEVFWRYYIDGMSIGDTADWVRSLRFPQMSRPSKQLCYD